MAQKSEKVSPTDNCRVCGNKNVSPLGLCEECHDIFTVVVVDCIQNYQDAKQNAKRVMASL